MTELKIIKNSIIEDKITSLFVKPIILKTKFWYSLTLPCTMIALEITINPMIMVTADINVTAIKTLFKNIHKVQYILFDYFFEFYQKLYLQNLLI